MDIEAELAALRARVERVEKQATLALTVADRAEVEIDAASMFEDVVVMPLLLRLAGFGHRHEIDQALAELQAQLRTDPEMAGTLFRPLQRVAYWREKLADVPRWHGFPPRAYRIDDDEEPEG